MKHLFNFGDQLGDGKLEAGGFIQVIAYLWQGLASCVSMDKDYSQHGNLTLALRHDLISLPLTESHKLSLFVQVVNVHLTFSKQPRELDLNLDDIHNKTNKQKKSCCVTPEPAFYIFKGPPCVYSSPEQTN